LAKEDGQHVLIVHQRYEQDTHQISTWGLKCRSIPGHRSYLVQNSNLYLQFDFVFVVSLFSFNGGVQSIIPHLNDGMKTIYEFVDQRLNLLLDATHRSTFS
jgi:hypothetical protein